jgi:hypothetical protein
MLLLEPFLPIRLGDSCALDYSGKRLIFLATNSFITNSGALDDRGEICVLLATSSLFVIRRS